MAEIVNIVASMRLAEDIDVSAVADELGIDYSQEQFPGMVYRVESPKVCLLLFRSGKAVATGATSVEDASFVCHRVKKSVSDLILEGYPKSIIEELPSYTQSNAELNEERIA